MQKPKFFSSRLRLASDIEQCEAAFADKANSIDRNFASVKKELGSLREEFEKVKDSGDPAKLKISKLKKLIEKRDLLKLKVEALEQEVEQLRGYQQKEIGLLNQAVHEKFEKMHGLLSYGLATGGLGPDAMLLFNTLGDFLDAKSEGDRASAQKAVNLILAHGDVFGEKQDKTATAEDEIARQFEAISDPEEATAFYNKHQTEILAAFEARKNNP